MALSGAVGTVGCDAGAGADAGKPGVFANHIRHCRWVMGVGAMAGHFRAKPNSTCFGSQAAKTFTVILKADGIEPAKIDVAKDTGGAEAND